MTYKLEIRSIYNLVGRIPKPEVIRIFQNQNISRRSIYPSMAECKYRIPCEILPKSGTRTTVFPTVIVDKKCRRRVSDLIL